MYFGTVAHPSEEQEKKAKQSSIKSLTNHAGRQIDRCSGNPHLSTMRHLPQETRFRIDKQFDNL